MRTRRLETALLAVSAAIGVVACATGPGAPPGQVLDSRVREPAIEVDGGRKDWEGELTRVGGRDVFAGFHRDGDRLYMAVVSQDPGFDARVFSGGLTVWFDPGAGRSKQFGVRFPVFDAAARKRFRADSAAGPSTRERLLRAAGPDFLLVLDGGEEVRAGGESGVRVAAAIDRGLFTYELRLPLGPGGDGAPPLSVRDTVAVGLQAGGDQGTAGPDTARERGVAFPDSAVDGGLRGPPRRGRRAEGPAGPAAGGGPPLEIWTRVSLRQPGGG